MSDDKNLANATSEPTEEEKQQEAEALKEAKDEEIRNEVITQYGLDEEVDAELIDKIVKETLVHKKALSVAIRQKIDWRAKAAKQPEKKEEIKKDDDKTKGMTKEELESYLAERDLKRDLDAVESSDELKKEIESYAKFKQISAKKALESPYIQSLKKAEDIKREEEEASAGRSSGTRTFKDNSKITNPTKAFDLKTEEGRKAYEKWASNPENLKNIPLE